MKRRLALPRMYRFLLINCAAGIVASWVLLAGLMWFDTAGLHSLMTASPDGMLAFILLAIGFAVTFGSAAAASAVMAMPYDDGGGGTHVTRPAPVARTHDRRLQRAVAR